MPRSQHFLTSLAAVILLLSACSSNPDSSDADAVPSSSTDPADTPTEADETDSSDSTEVPQDDPDEPSVPEVLVDVGVTDDEIRIGYSFDLSGPLSAIDSLLLDAHVEYFRDVNAAGGIAGRRVEIVALDHASDRAAHVDNVAQLAERGENGVAAFGSVGGGELAVAAVPTLVAENIGAVVRGSLDAGRRGDADMLSVGATTCIETVNGLDALVDEFPVEDPPTLAIVTRDDLYGRQSAAAARSLTELGQLEVLIDRRVTDDNTTLIAELIEAEPDIVWVAVSPRELASVLGAMLDVQAEWKWAGAPQSYDASLLRTAAAPAIERWYTHVASIETFEGPGTDGRARSIRSALPDVRYSGADSVAFGWQQAEVLHAALSAAAETGDLTRSSIAATLSTRATTEASVYLFSVDPNVATPDVMIGQTGATGLVEGRPAPPLPATAVDICG